MVKPGGYNNFRNCGERKGWLKNVALMRLGKKDGFEKYAGRDRVIVTSLDVNTMLIQDCFYGNGIERGRDKENTNECRVETFRVYIFRMQNVVHKHPPFISKRTFVKSEATSAFRFSLDFSYSLNPSDISKLQSCSETLIQTSIRLIAVWRQENFTNFSHVFPSTT
jgi:hypothetical protein